MKESFQRLVQWARDHPWLTALILGGVALLAYLTYKNGWFGIGSGGSSVSTVPDSSTVAGGADTGTGGGGSSDLGSLGSSISPAPSPTYTGAEQGASAGLAGVGTIPSANLDSLFGAPVSVVPDTSAAPLASGASLSSINLSGFSTGGLAQPQAQAPAQPKQNQTPSMVVGKGRRFTGVYQGVQYENGYPVTGSQASGIVATLSPTVQAPASQVQNFNTATAQSLRGAIGNVGTSTVVISRNTATAPSLKGATGTAGGH